MVGERLWTYSERGASKTSRLIPGAPTQSEVWNSFLRNDDMKADTQSRARFAIFDMDGLLLDTESIYTEATQHVVGQYGKTFDWSIKSHMIGRPALDSARYLVSTLDLPISAEAYLEARETWLLERFPHCKPMHGAKALVRHLRDSKVPIAVATSSVRRLFELKTTNHQEMFNMFDLVVTGDDPEVKHGKPAPDIFAVAAARLGATPSETLVFEDAPSGLAAGIAAGMRVIVVPDPNMDKSRYAEATLVLDSLAEFNPRDFELT